MLYRYKTYQDVRLVFAPEEQAATFGGDYDNFTYPRYALDFALLRVYEEGQPLRPEHFLRLSDKAANAQEMVIAVGHPASTQRGLTVAQRQYHRDTQNPLQIGILQKRIAALTTYMAQGSEQARRQCDRPARHPWQWPWRCRGHCSLSRCERSQQLHACGCDGRSA